MRKNTKKKLITGLVLWLSMILAMPVYGDDTEIYGGITRSVKPNVLILFDTSGSMTTKDVPKKQQSAVYEPSTTYTGEYNSSAIYADTYQTIAGRSARIGWEAISDSHTALTASVKNKLNRDGYADGLSQFTVRPGFIGVTYTATSVAKGNHLNWREGKMKRQTAAIEAISEVVKDTEGVRFGLMRFRDKSPLTGMLRIEIKDMDEGNNKEELLKEIARMPASGGTPLATSLSEAGWYFAGKPGWNNVPYTSPVQWECQKNYVILMTDGKPESGDNQFLGDNASQNYKNGDKYIHGVPIPKENGPDNRLVDVARYLYTKGTDPDNIGKNIVATYTIGFKTDQALLKETAKVGSPLGEDGYFTVETKEDLQSAFETLIGSILQVDSIFVSPVVPVNQQNRTFAGDSLYVGFFRPNTSAAWEGNLKKYALGSDGNIYNKNKTTRATHATTGAILETAQSFWSDGADGAVVPKGGAGGVLQKNTARKLYTNLNEEKPLWLDANRFDATNPNLTSTILGVESNEDRTKTIDTIVNGVTSSEKDVGLWKMGDVLHSTPAVVAYGSESDDTYIFAGTNRGVLHVFNDKTGEEVWGFIPEPQLKNLRKLHQQPTVHHYFVDGAPVVYQGCAGEKFLLVGERRGGSNYYALDVTSITSPEHSYTIPATWIENETNEALTATLAQSWANPTTHMVYTNSINAAPVFLMVGGYDPQHDVEAWRGKTPAGKTKGNSVFMIKVNDGSVTGLDSTNLEGGTVDIPHSIVDATGFDYNDDTRTDRVYAGDLGGNIWAFEDHDDPHIVNKKPNGQWTGKKLFSDGNGRKIFYAPDVVLENGELGVEDMIFFGTGDRAAPKDISVVNRIYAVRNNWLVTSMAGKTPDVNLTPDDLYDATKNLIQEGTPDQQRAHGDILASKRGWYFDLEHLGEKIISSVLVYNGVLYFTTYTPDVGGGTGAPVNDPCTVDIAGLGTARLYAVDYRNGTAVLNFDTTNDPTGGTVLKKSDRSTVIGQAIPSSPVIAILEGKAVLFVGISGGIATKDPLQGQALNRFYWNMPLE